MKQVSSSPEVIRFGVFEADTRTGELRKHGQRIKLQEQPFQVLSLLLARPGELVTREELRLKLWPADTFVDFEHGLNKAINKLREALGDNRETPRYIETFPRRGYRFIAPALTDQRSSNPIGSGAEPTALPHPVPSGSARRVRWITFAMVLMLLVLVLVASALLYRLARRQLYPAAATFSAAPIRSLAVLPLQNLSGEKDQEYFADGMTDELITDLGQMSALRVISRTSIMQYKGTSKTLPQIGRELGADAILEGAVFRSGTQVRITAQLIDARTDKHLWAHGYERDLRDVITMQDEVARDIADEIKVELTPQERMRLAGSRPVNPEAHEAYLKGLYYWNQFTEADVKKSGGFFQQAIEKDPNYALGYSGLANYFGVMYVRFDDYSRSDACPKAEAAGLKAVELDDSLAEAHHSLGGIRLFCDWDWQGAESELKRAIQLNPNFAEPRRVYANLLAFQGHANEAVAETERAVENDPMSADLSLNLGWIYYLTRHYDHAVTQYRKAIDMDPNRPENGLGLGNVYVQRGQLDLAIREYRKAVELSGEAPWALSDLGYADALAGKRREALEILKQLSEMSKHRPVPALDRALLYISLGDKQQALAWIEKAYEQHDGKMLLLRADPHYDSLRSDPRFQDLLRRMNYPP
ncbi:MAG TPA: tetratricopeptide repeat protein [Terriglobia bacterium]|nr:tetratricopeptide repeat protein [Terriglobia bacterium]